MNYYDFILRFDDDKHSLTAKNGLPISEVSELLASLSRAVPLGKEDKLVLSEVRGNCYALAFSTNSLTVQSNLKIVHKQISLNDYTGLNRDQRNYAGVLHKITNGRYYLKAYDSKKEFNIDVGEIELPELPESYYEIGTFLGSITQIGGRTLKGKSIIHVEGFSTDVIITLDQEKLLYKHFKKLPILFTIKKKVDVKSRDIKSAELITFTITGEHKLAETAKKISSKLSNEFLDNIDQYYLNT